MLQIRDASQPRRIRSCLTPSLPSSTWSPLLPLSATSPVRLSSCSAYLLRHLPTVSTVFRCGSLTTLVFALIDTRSSGPSLRPFHPCILGINVRGGVTLWCQIMADGDDDHPDSVILVAPPLLVPPPSLSPRVWLKHNAFHLRRICSRPAMMSAYSTGSRLVPQIG